MLCGAGLAQAPQHPGTNLCITDTLGCGAKMCCIQDECCQFEGNEFGWPTLVITNRQLPLEVVHGTEYPFVGTPTDGRSEGMVLAKMLNEVPIVA